jgi:hypothetical protein
MISFGFSSISSDVGLELGPLEGFEDRCVVEIEKTLDWRVGLLIELILHMSSIALLALGLADAPKEENVTLF